MPKLQPNLKPVSNLKSKQVGAVLIFALILVALSTLSLNTLLQQLLSTEKRKQMNTFWLRADEILDNEASLQLASIKRNANQLWDQLQPIPMLHSMNVSAESDTVKTIKLKSVQQLQQGTIEVLLKPVNHRCISQQAIFNFLYLCLELTMHYLKDNGIYKNQTSSRVHFVLLKADH